MPTNVEVQHCAQYVNNVDGGKNTYEIVKLAWEDIQQYRLDNCGYKLDVVAAEHYLYTRMVAGCHPLAFLIMVPLLTVITAPYDIFKAVCKKTGMPMFLQESDCPPSDPSPWVRAWSYTGACDGARDTKCGNKPVIPAKPNWYGRALTYPYAEEPK